MTKFYRVAGHVFAMTLPEGLFKYMEQYSPFAAAEVPDPLFRLALVQELPEVQAETVYDPPTEVGQTRVTLSHFDGGWLFEMSADRDLPVSARMMTDEDFSQGRLLLSTRKVHDGVFGVNNAAMLLYAFRSAPFGTLELHASMVSNAGRAFLFMAKSGTGKSTHSSLWLEHVPGSELMNDDNPVVRI